MKETEADQTHVRNQQHKRERPKFKQIEKNQTLKKIEVIQGKGDSTSCKTKQAAVKRIQNKKYKKLEIKILINRQEN